MTWREYVRVAARALRANLFRSALTVSSITLGAFSIVLMSSLAASGLATLAADIERIGGARIILIASKKPERAVERAAASPGYFTRRDIELLESKVPHLEAFATIANLDRADVLSPSGQRIRTDVVGANGGFFDALSLGVQKGRVFSEEEVDRHARVCVVGYKVAERLFEGDAVGRWITVGPDRCRIVGQLDDREPMGVNFGFEWLDFVTLPLETALETRPEARRGVVIHMRSSHVSKNDIVKRVANVVLADRHRGVDDYLIWDFNSFMAQFETIFAVMKAIVGLIAGIALVVGGIGVMNMTLVSVSERTREIGIRKALGASGPHIARQFLCEATALSGLGGLVGVLLGVGATVLAHVGIARLAPVWVGEISYAAVGIAVVVSFAIGVGFGFVPAQKASRLDPVEAIRR